MSYIVKDVHAGIIDLLKNADNLREIITEAYSYYAYGVGANEQGKITLYVIPGPSTGEEVIHDSPQSENLRTEFTIIADTILDQDANAFQSEAETGSTLFDFEEKVLFALQERAFLGVNGVMGWRVSEIKRDEPVIGLENEIDYETRRIEITILVDIIYQRQNHDR